MIEVIFPHRVPVTRKGRKKKREWGLLIGTRWYIIQNTSEDAEPDPGNNFDIGSNVSGLKLVGGLSFWEAHRVVLALEDSGMEEESEDHDLIWIWESIFSSALMDHYVYPIDGWEIK